MRLSLSRSFVVAFAASLVGCASVTPNGSQTMPQPPSTPDPAASRIEAAIAQGQGERKADVDTARPQASYSWSRTTTDYFGDAAVFLREVAQGVGVRAVISGPQPTIPIFIRIQAENEPLDEVLRRVAEQLGGRADVVLRNTSIEMRYRPQ